MMQSQTLSQNPKRIYLAAGGTGGHFFPALSLARVLQKRGHQVVMMTDNRAFKYGQQLEALDIRTTRSATFFAGSFIARLFAPLKITFGVLQAMGFYLRQRPHAVIGFGGYPSFVPLMAARFLFIPIAIHEQNAVLGRANKALIKIGAAVAVSYVGTKHVPHRKRKHLEVTGNPLREEIIALTNEDYQPPLADEAFNLLVFGGSQGASILSEVVPAAVAKLPAEKRQRLKLVQQCRRAELRDTLKIYNDNSVNVELRDFFQDLPERMHAAHLIIARSGASTVSELAVMGRPAILVPLPGAIDQDQMNNAVQLSNHDGAFLMEQKLFTPETLSVLLGDLMDQPQRLKAVAQAAQKRSVRDATDRLADFAEKIAGCPDKPASYQEVRT
ncbi:MAG: undecaprenyldiphospho-muramoylpentapeptide beta-N-acetylglucosaminyltransferase [Parvibaculales bacterium]